MKLLCWIVWCLAWQMLPAQEIQFMRTAYADDFREWRFFDSEEQELGNLRARWIFSDDLSQWDVRMGEWSGAIQLRWKDRPDEWEVRLQNDFFTAAPTWPGQIDSWRITNHDDTYYLKLERDPDGFQWSLEKGANTLFYVYNEYFLDLRDWVISYEVNEPLPASLMLTALFIVSYYSTPK